MKALRTTGIIVSVALAAAALAVLPSVEEEAPQERAGITIGDASDAGGGSSFWATAEGRSQAAVRIRARPRLNAILYSAIRRLPLTAKLWNKLRTETDVCPAASYGL